MRVLVQVNETRLTRCIADIGLMYAPRVTVMTPTPALFPASSGTRPSCQRGEDPGRTPSTVRSLFSRLFPSMHVFRFALSLPPLPPTL